MTFRDVLDDTFQMFDAQMLSNTQFRIEIAFECCIRLSLPFSHGVQNTFLVIEYFIHYWVYSEINTNIYIYIYIVFLCLPQQA